MTFLVVSGLILCLLAVRARGADFHVTSSNFAFYANNIGPNPTFTLIRGFTYRFSIATDAFFHPFVISPTNGLSTNNLTSGTITFIVPTNAGNYTYQCGFHQFGGNIFTVPLRVSGIVPNRPPLETPTLLLRMHAGSNATLRPEFKTDVTGNWSPLTVLSNRFLNNANELFCGQPPGPHVFVRVFGEKL